MEKYCPGTWKGALYPKFLPDKLRYTVRLTKLCAKDGEGRTPPASRARGNTALKGRQDSPASGAADFEELFLKYLYLQALSARLP